MKSIVIESAKYNIPITFSGGKSGLSAGYANYGVLVDLLDLQILSKPFEIDLEKRIIIADQYVYVSDLIKQVSRHSKGELIFQIQPSSAFKLPVTVGGLISTNASGVTSGKLGDTSDWVVEIKILKPNGDIEVVDKKNDLFE